MRPRGKLLALFAVFAAIGLVTASGAFTTVQAERTADVNVAGDASALVAIEAGSDDVADDYVQDAGEGSDGQLEISLTGSFDDGNGNGQGINQDARTEVDNVFTITNQGSQPVDIHILLSGSASHSEHIEFTNPNARGSSSFLDSDNSMVGDGNGVPSVGPGSQIRVSIVIDTGVKTDDAGLASGDEILNEITIVADESS